MKIIILAYMTIYWLIKYIEQEMICNALKSKDLETYTNVCLKQK